MSSGGGGGSGITLFPLFYLLAYVLVDFLENIYDTVVESDYS